MTKIKISVCIWYYHKKDESEDYTWTLSKLFIASKNFSDNIKLPKKGCKFRIDDLPPIITRGKGNELILIIGHTINQMQIMETIELLKEKEWVISKMNPYIHF